MAAVSLLRYAGYSKKKGADMDMTIIRKKYINAVWISLFVLYGIGVMYFTLFWRSAGWSGQYIMRLNPIPLFWVWEPLLTDHAFSPVHVILNVILFLPIGFLAGVLFPAARIKKIAGSALLFSLFIELIQPFFGRITDVDDLLLNMLGGVLGFFLLMVARRMVEQYQLLMWRPLLYRHCICPGIAA